MKYLCPNIGIQVLEQEHADRSVPVIISLVGRGHLTLAGDNQPYNGIIYDADDEWQIVQVLKDNVQSPHITEQEFNLLVCDGKVFFSKQRTQEICEKMRHYAKFHDK